MAHPTAHGSDSPPAAAAHASPAQLRLFRIQRFLRHHLLALVVAGGVSNIALLAVAILVKPFGGRGYTAVEDILPIPVYLASAGFAVMAARRTAAKPRLAWSLIAAGFFSYAIGDGAWAVCEVGLQSEPSTPSFADPFYLAVIPLLLFGIMLLSSAARTLGNLRTGLDGAIIVLALTAVVWDTVLGPTLGAAQTGFAGTLVTAAYPVGDIMLVFAVSVALRRQWKGRARIVLYMFAGGMLLATVADLAYARMVIDGTYQSGSLVDLGWPAGFVLMGLAAAMQVRWSVDFAAEVGDMVPSNVEPCVVSLTLGGWVLVRGLRGDLADDLPLLAIVGGVLFASVLRYAVVSADARHVRKGLMRRRGTRFGRAWTLEGGEGELNDGPLERELELADWSGRRGPPEPNLDGSTLAARVARLAKDRHERGPESQSPTQTGESREGRTRAG